jgi:hypothetical protein
MLQQKIARLAEDFAAQLVGMFTTVPLDDLVDDLASPRAPATKVAARSTVTRSKKTSAAPKRAPKSVPVESAPHRAPEPEASSPSPEMIATALAFFAERGSRGATAHQLGEHLAALGFARSADVTSVLAQSGSIRDAGFRRAAGKNATAPVFVAA